MKLVDHGVLRVGRSYPGVCRRFRAADVEAIRRKFEEAIPEKATAACTRK
jgi:hypothetical protein